MKMVSIIWKRYENW